MQSVTVPAVGSYEVADRPIPVPDAGSVLVRVLVTGFCRTDLKVIEVGHRDLTLPRIPGEEVVGDVVQCGASVRADWLGMRVYVYPGIWCGSCENCRKGATNLCASMQIMGFHRDGGFAAYVVVPEQSLIRLPQDLAPEIAVFAEPLSCCLHALEMARLAEGERLCVIGGGPAGTLLARAALALGAAAVTIVEPDVRRHRWHGGTTPCSGTYDVAIPAVGSAAAYRQACALLAPRGRLVAFSGLSRDDLPPLDWNALHYQEQTVVGSYGCEYRHGEWALQLLSDQRVVVQDLITHNLPLAEVGQALDIVRNRAGMKVLLYPGKG